MVTAIDKFFASQSFFHGFGSTATMILYVLITGLVLLLIFFFIWSNSYDYKITIWRLYGSGKDGALAFDRPTTNSIKWSRDKLSWRLKWPMFNNRHIEPFDGEYIYPGKRLMAVEFNGTLKPLRLNINQTESDIRAEINPVPYYVRNWQCMEHKKNAEEFVKRGFWEENKFFIITLITVLVCLVLCGVTIYFTYKYAGGGTDAMRGLTEALKNFANVPAATPK